VRPVIGRWARDTSTTAAQELKSNRKQQRFRISHRVPSWVRCRAAPASLFGHLLSGWLVLVENPHLDVASRLVGQILLTVYGATRNIIAVAP
jgi:hypothetical protein